MTCAMSGSRAGAKPRHGARTPVSFRLGAELLTALSYGARRRGLIRNDLFCQLVAGPAGMRYAVPATFVLAVAPPPPLLLSSASPKRFDIPNDILAGLRNRAEGLGKTLTALVIETLEKELGEDIAAVRNYLDELKTQEDELKTQEGASAMAQAS